MVNTENEGGRGKKKDGREEREGMGARKTAGKRKNRGMHEKREGRRWG